MFQTTGWFARCGRVVSETTEVTGTRTLTRWIGDITNIRITAISTVAGGITSAADISTSTKTLTGRADCRGGSSCSTTDA